MRRVSKRKYIFAIVAAVFIICIFFGSILLKRIGTIENEDPIMHESTIEAEIIDIQITVLQGHISHIVIYALTEYTGKNGSVYAFYPDENTVITDTQGNQLDCSWLVVGQNIKVPALCVVSYTGWLNRETGESFPAEGLHTCYEITIMD